MREVKIIKGFYGYRAVKTVRPKGIHDDSFSLEGEEAEPRSGASRMNFKSMLEEDNRRVFLNTGEFAEMHTVRYDADILVLFIKRKELDKTVRNMEGTVQRDCDAPFCTRGAWRRMTNDRNLCQ